MRRERIDLRVTESEKTAWEKLADRNGLSLSELIRQSVEAYRKPRRGKLKASSR